MPMPPRTFSCVLAFAVASAAAPSGQLVALKGSGADGFGRSVAVGEIDGLPGDDVIVGAPSAALGAGEVHVFFATGASVVLGAGGQGAAFGFDVAAGDLDGDGLDDVIVGAPGDGGGAGAVHVYLAASAGATWPSSAPHGHQGSAGDALGSSVATLPSPLAADRALHYAAGAPTGAMSAVFSPFEPVVSDPPRGYVAVYSGATGEIAAWFGPVTSTGPVTIVAPDSNVLFGEDLAGGDFDGDGLGDLAVVQRITELGVPQRVCSVHASDGSAPFKVEYLWLTPPPPPEGAAYGTLIDEFGAAVLATVGDVDLDGDDDLGFGLPTAGGGAGLGGLRDVSAGAFLAQVPGKPGDQQGLAVAAAGDVNADGHPDFLLGNGHGGYEIWAGGAAGADTLLGQPIAIPETGASDPIASLASADFNDDGLRDPVIGVTAGALADTVFVSAADPKAFSLVRLGGPLSVSQGGNATFLLSAGEEHAGDTFLMLASVGFLPSGGTLPDGSSVWLSPDWLLQLTLANPGTLFDGNPGTLTSSTTIKGTGIARIFAGPGDLAPWSTGLAPKMFVQYLVFSPGMAVVGGASQVVAVPVIP
jgi:hypothetical protein